MEKLGKLLNLLGPEDNYKNYRGIAHEIPCIPLLRNSLLFCPPVKPANLSLIISILFLRYLAMHLRDISYLQEIHSNFVDESKQVVNLGKLYLIGSHIYPIISICHGMKQYNIAEDIIFRDCLLSLMALSLDSEKLYKASVALQPLREDSAVSIDQELDPSVDSNLTTPSECSSEANSPLPTERFV